MSEVAAPDARRLGRLAQKNVMAERKAAVMAAVMVGDHQGKIAEDLGLTVNQVKNAIRKSMRDAQKTFEAGAKTYRGRLLAKNQWLQKELWRAYERVKERGKVTQVLRKKADGTEQAIEVTQTTAPEAEARLLQAILKAQEQEGRICGLNEDKGAGAPPQLPTVSPGNSLVVVNNADLDDDIPWLKTIERGFAVQGVGLLPAGSPDPEAPVDATIVE